MMRLCILLCISLLFIASAHEDHTHGDDEIDQEFAFVTCGSSIKLQHIASGFRLHSHKVTYGSGSGQQSVTGYADAADSNSLWKIIGPHGSFCPTGKVLKSGDTFRLQHVNTKKLLHSHLHKSPLTQNNEVSCFGEEGVGDTGDNWVVRVPSNSEWKRGETVKLQHVDTKFFLRADKNAKFQNPIPGQLEISAIKASSKDTEWASAEGIYFPELIQN